LNSATCPGTIQTNQLTVAPGPGSTVKWTINSACASILGPDNGTNVNVTASTCCSYSLTVVITNADQTISSCQLNSGSFVDTNPPSITCPTGVTLNCPADTRTNITGVATASDTCTGVTISYSDLTNSGCGGSYTILRTWTATDACTNSASCVQTITVQDTNPPSITCPVDMTLDCPADTRTNVTGVATATDTCSSLSISYSDVTNSGCGGSYTILRTWMATDACTNSASCVQAITVQDTNPPSITCPAGVTLNCPADTRTNATG